MKKDPKIFLRHILDSITEIENNIKNISEKKFSRSTPIQDAVIRRLEIIGEAAKNIPENIREKYNFIPWKKIAGSRKVDLQAVWDTVTKDIPQLKQDVKTMLEKL